MKRTRYFVRNNCCGLRTEENVRARAVAPCEFVVSVFCERTTGASGKLTAPTTITTFVTVLAATPLA